MNNKKIFVLLFLFAFILLFSNTQLKCQSFKDFAKDFIENAGTDIETFKSYCASSLYTTDCDNGQYITITKKIMFNYLKISLQNSKHKIDKNKKEISFYIDQFYGWGECYKFKLINGDWKLYYYMSPC